MGICVPKNITCGWYTPTFTSGSTPCTLLSYDESRSRVALGGSFFRSIDVGTHTNDITISNIWQVDDGGWRAYNSDTDTLEDVGRVELSITDGTIVELYHADQRYSDSSSSWIVNAIPSLRGLLSASILITMPSIDIPQPWDSSINGGDHLTEFIVTNLSGGTGGPTTQGELAFIRTGPASTIIYINNSEVDNVDGSSTELRETRYWNGYCYKLYNPTIPDCTDPSLSVGSPPTGSPLFCELGPEADC